MWSCLHSKYRSQGGHGINKNNRRPLRRPNHKSQIIGSQKRDCSWLQNRGSQVRKMCLMQLLILIRQVYLICIWSGEVLTTDIKKTLFEKRLDNELKYDNFSMLKS